MEKVESPPVLVIATTRNLTSFEYEVQASDASKVSKFCKYARPILASVVAALGSVVVGTMNGYPSPAVPNLNDNRNPFRMDTEEQSWFGSFLFLAGIPGALFGSYVIDRFGRKWSLLMVSLPFVIGWTIIAGSYNPIMMYIGRITCGFCFAIVLSTIGVYISEISPPEIRGILISFHELGINVGVLVTYVVGMYVPWNWLAIFCASISCVQATLLMLVVPETPRWLLMKGQKEMAIQSLAWLRGHGTHLEQEIAVIQQSLQESAEPVPWKDYFRPPLLRCLLITMALYVIQQLSGVNLVRTYTVNIFEDTGSHMNPYILTVVIGAVMLAGSFLGTLVVDCFERRTLLLFSTLLMALSMGALGAFFEVKEVSPYFAKTYIYWLPLASLITVSVGYVVGAATIPNVVTSELFSTRARGRASSVCIATLCFCGFLSTKLYSNLVKGIGAAGAFWVCAGVCLVGSVVIFLFVPMTKGQSLEHIQSNLGQ